MEAQGHSIDHNVVFQDNQATMHLEMNGVLSSVKCTRHIHARYFFITDRIEAGDVEVEYCPTEEMWADVLNKPKQGKAFRVDRSYLMNVPEDYDDEAERLQTHPELLPKDEPESVPTVQPEADCSRRRSVLGDKLNVSLSHSRSRRKDLHTRYGAKESTWRLTQQRESQPMARQ